MSVERSKRSNLAKYKRSSSAKRRRKTAFETRSCACARKKWPNKTESAKKLSRQRPKGSRKPKRPSANRLQKSWRMSKERRLKKLNATDFKNSKRSQSGRQTQNVSRKSARNRSKHSSNSRGRSSTSHQIQL